MRAWWIAIATVGCGFDAKPVPDGCAMCVAPAPVCDTTTNTCVECVAGSDCEATAPVCDNHACRACATNTECASGACLPTGACADAGSVAYVREGGTDNATCDLMQPCATVSAAIATRKPTIKVTGTISGHVGIDSLTLSIVGDPGAALESTASIGSILDVSGTSLIAIDHVSIGGASSPNVGITVNGGTLQLHDVTIDGCINGGITVSSGMLVLHQSTVSNNAGGGITINGAAAHFDISNTFVFRNGNISSSVVGGARLVQFANDGMNRFEFNTIVDNHIATNSTNAGGVTCDTNGFVTANNIIARNDVNGDTTLSNANILGVCNFATSFVGTSATELDFVNPDAAPFDYRIQSGSVAIDQGTTPSPVDVDHDGQHRPARANKDEGAFEVQ
jgi:hypothetical protein